MGISNYSLIGYEASSIGGILMSSTLILVKSDNLEVIDGKV